MNLSSCRIRRINKYLLFLIISFSFSSCFLKEENYRKQENYDKLMQETIKFADRYNNKEHRELNTLFNTPFKINKEKVVKNKTGAYLYYEISVPYNLRENELKKFLEEFSNTYMKKREHLIIDVKHLFIEKFSGVVARYEVKRSKRSIKTEAKLTDYLTRERLLKKGIKHYLLEYEQSILAQLNKEMEQKKLSLKSAVIKVALHYKVQVDRINEIIKFARKYYKK